MCKDVLYHRHNSSHVEGRETNGEARHDYSGGPDRGRDERTSETSGSPFVEVSKQPCCDVRTLTKHARKTMPGLRCLACIDRKCAASFRGGMKHGVANVKLMAQPSTFFCTRQQTSSGTRTERQLPWMVCATWPTMCASTCMMHQS